MVPFVDREQLRLFLLFFFLFSFISPLHSLLPLLLFLFFIYSFFLTWVRLFSLLLAVTQDPLFSCLCSAI